MKKICSFVLAAAVATTVHGSVFADSLSSDKQFALNNRVITENADVDLFASVDGISFEYDYSASTELVRVVKVKYDKSYFTSGINKFKAQISVPSEYTASVSYSTKLTGFEINDGYSSDVYTCSGESGTDKIPSDGVLFTMRITLKENILNPFTISLTGDSYIGDSSGVTMSLENGLNTTSIEIPKNINDVGDSGTDGAITWEYANEVLKIHGDGIMKDYEKGDAPWYKYADKIKSIEFTEDNLSNIGENAFYGLYNAENVTLSSDIRTINNGAFEGCTNLKNIDIPTNSGVGIGEYAFKDCSKLTSVYIPSGVRSIGRGAFEGCNSISSMTLPFIGMQKGESNTRNTFSCIFNGSVPSALKVVSITNETNVPESAFEGCSYIENIYLNSDIKTIGEKAFKGCTSLKSMVLPTEITEITNYMFQDCSSIAEIDIHDNINAIGAGAFDGCRKLLSIYIPSKVTQINDYTFRNCESLTAIEIPKDVTHIGEDVLAGCTKLVDVKVPFVGVNADPGSTAPVHEGTFGYFFGVENNEVPASVTTVEVTSTERGNYIPMEAFKNCGYIEDIIIDGGRNILNSAFANCKNLKNLYIPKSIQSVGTNILADCTKLETLTVPFIGVSRNDENKETSVLGGFFGYDDTTITGTMQYYDGENYHYYKVPRTLKNVSVLNQTTIPMGAFMNCDFIENVSIVTGASMGDEAFYNCVALKEVLLPNDLQTIGEQAFAECESLETVNIPTKVKTIGNNAFYNCRGLKNVTMPDSVTEIASDVFNGTGLFGLGEVNLLANAGTITCSEGSYAQQYAEENGIATNIVPSKSLDVKKMGATIATLSTGEWLVNITDTVGASVAQGATNIYAALYDNNGAVKAAKSAEVSSEDADYRIRFSADEIEGVSEAKVFVWGGDSGMESLTEESTELELPDEI